MASTYHNYMSIKCNNFDTTKKSIFVSSFLKIMFFKLHTVLHIEDNLPLTPSTISSNEQPNIFLIQKHLNRNFFIGVINFV